MSAITTLPTPTKPALATTRRLPARPPSARRLRTQAEEVLRELAFVYQAVRTVRQALTATA